MSFCQGSGTGQGLSRTSKVGLVLACGSNTCMKGALVTTVAYANNAYPGSDLRHSRTFFHAGRTFAPKSSVNKACTAVRYHVAK